MTQETLIDVPANEPPSPEHLWVAKLNEALRLLWSGQVAQEETRTIAALISTAADLPFARVTELEGRVKELAQDSVEYEAEVDDLRAQLSDAEDKLIAAQDFR